MSQSDHFFADKRAVAGSAPARRVRDVALVILFLVVVCLTVLFLHLFTATSESMTYIDWSESVRIEPDGSTEPISTDVMSDSTTLEGTFRFTGALPGGLPEGHLLFETSGLAMTVTLNGEEIWNSSVTTDRELASFAGATVPLPVGASGELVVTCEVIDGDSVLFPPLVRFAPETFEDEQIVTFANREAFPAGASALAFVLVVGLFLLSCSLGGPEWSLLALIVATGGLVMYFLSSNVGYSFVPDWMTPLLDQRVVGLMVVVALAVYLAMNRRRQFWRLLGITTLCSVLVIGCWYLVSLASDGYMASFVNQSIATLLQMGYYSGILYWIVLWFTVVSGLISAYGVARSMVDRRVRQQGLELRNEMTLEGYRALEEKVHETAALRHELRGRLMTLDCLLQAGDYQQASALVREMCQTGVDQAQTSFTDNVAINIILQDVAARARKAGVEFDAQALVPTDLGIPEHDLCTLLMNMLDNALEACQRMEGAEGRFVRLRIKVVRGFLAISCENTFGGELRADEEGQLLTTKDDPDSHGFGLRQMSRVAKHYGGGLTVRQTDDGVFVVQVALQLPEGMARAEGEGAEGDQSGDRSDAGGSEPGPIG